MKRTIVATTTMIMLGVTPQLAEAQTPRAELYGDMRYSYNYADFGGDSGWRTANNVSRLGARAMLERGAYRALVDFQAGVNVDDALDSDAFSQRYFRAELQSPFGTLSAGRESNAYKVAGFRVDPFYDISTVSATGGVPTGDPFGGAAFGLSLLSNGFADGTLAYRTPSFGGLSLNGGVHLDRNDDHDYGVGLNFAHSGFEADVQQYWANGTAWSSTAGVDDALRVSASYSYEERWSLGGSFERLEGLTGETQDFMYLAGTVTVREPTHLAAAVGRVEDSPAVQAITGMAYHVGIFHEILPQLQLHAVGSYLDRDEGEARSNFGVGFVYGFQLGR